MHFMATTQSDHPRNPQSNQTGLRVKLQNQLGSGVLRAIESTVTAMEIVLWDMSSTCVVVIDD